MTERGVECPVYVCQHLRDLHGPPLAHCIRAQRLYTPEETLEIGFFEERFHHILLQWTQGGFNVESRVDKGNEGLSEQKKTFETVLQSRLISKYSARTVLSIGMPMAEGELEYRRGHFERAFALLFEAVRRDDSLH